MKKILFLTFSIFMLYCCGSSQQVNERSDVERVYPELDIDRFEAEIEAFEEQDIKTRYPSGMALFVGSSSIRFWSTMADDLAPHNVLNRGFGGSTLPEVNHYFERIVSKYKPAQIFLYCGENDLAMTFTVRETFDAFVEFLTLCKKYVPDSKIIYISMKPSPSRWHLWPKYEEANTLIKNVCTLSNQMTYVDVSEIMMTQDEVPDSSIFVEDMLHMNASGYERWTEVIKPVIDQLRE